MYVAVFFLVYRKVIQNLYGDRGVGDLPEIVCCNRIHGYTPPQEYRVCGYRCCCIRLFLRHAPATSFQVYPDTPPQEICNRINCIRITSTRRQTFKNCNRIHLQPDPFATGSTCNRIHLQPDPLATGSTCNRINLQPEPGTNKIRNYCMPCQNS